MMGKWNSPNSMRQGGPNTFSTFISRSLFIPQIKEFFARKGCSPLLEASWFALKEKSLVPVGAEKFLPKPYEDKRSPPS